MVDVAQLGPGQLIGVEELLERSPSWRGTYVCSAVVEGFTMQLGDFAARLLSDGGLRDRRSAALLRSALRESQVCGAWGMGHGRVCWRCR